MVDHHPPAHRPRHERKTVFADEYWNTLIDKIPQHTRGHNTISGNSKKRTEENHEH